MSHKSLNFFVFGDLCPIFYTRTHIYNWALTIKLKVTFVVVVVIVVVIVVVVVVVVAVVVHKEGSAFVDFYLLTIFLQCVGISLQKNTFFGDQQC